MMKGSLNVRKRLAVFAAASAIAFVTAPAANAKKPALEPLADVVESSCTFMDDSVDANWTYAGGGEQTKWGGDLECAANGTLDGVDFADEVVEFEVSFYDGTDTDGVVWYECNRTDGPGTGDLGGEANGTCDAEGTGISKEAIEAILTERFGTQATVTSYMCSPLGIKAMKPGKGGGPQNYPKVNIDCTNVISAP